MASTPAGPIRITEVGPRDGLQNEPATIPLEAKIRFIDALAETGLREIEVGAFVRPDRVPQMADTAEVFEGLKRRNGVVYSALVPNEQGVDRALEVEADKIAVFTAASETFNQKNINASVAESIRRFRDVIPKAKSKGLPVRAYVSTAFWCPYEGKIDPRKVLDVCALLMDMGVDELSVGDTIGKASPNDVRALLEFLLPKFQARAIFLHFHDTYGMAVANALCAWQEFGITGFDASAGGLGGCPFAPGASGNVATEDLLYAFKSSGAKIPADPFRIAGTLAALSPHLGRDLASRLSRVRREA